MNITYDAASRQYEIETAEGEKTIISERCLQSLKEGKCFLQKVADNEEEPEG